MSHSVLERLQREHRQIATLLQVLEHQTAAIERGDRPDYALMYEVLHYLTHYPDRYHHVFEDLLFERLAYRRHDLKYTIDSLAEQHATLTQNGIRLRILVEAVLSDLPVERTGLVRHAYQYHTAYHEHLQCEETGIFPALESSLIQSDWMTLLTRFEWRMDPLAVGEDEQQYRLIVNTLNTMGVDYTALKSSYIQTCPACSGQQR